MTRSAGACGSTRSHHSLERRHPIPLEDSRPALGAGGHPLAGGRTHRAGGVTQLPLTSCSNSRRSATRPSPRSVAAIPAQYALAKLRLPEAHALAKGEKVLIALIDSGIDTRHPELEGMIADSFDALKSDEKAHAHGTAVAGAIVAHARLMGVAPEARILAVRRSASPRSGHPRPPPTTSTRASTGPSTAAPASSI